VTLIGRARHVEAIRRDGLFLESIHFQDRVPVAAVEAARAAEIVLFCVKTLDTESAALSPAVCSECGEGVAVARTAHGWLVPGITEAAGGDSAIFRVGSPGCSLNDLPFPEPPLSGGDGKNPARTAKSPPGLLIELWTLASLSPSSFSPRFGRETAKPSLGPRVLY